MAANHLSINTNAHHHPALRTSPPTTPAPEHTHPHDAGLNHNHQLSLFVPGRLCLLGEHSDWAGTYRVKNPAISSGRALVAGTTEGLHARASKCEGKLLLTSTLNDGTSQSFECELNEATLLHHASDTDNFFSYACGVVYELISMYDVGGLKLDNYQTTLPIKKGLSSSAALCVLVARAYNQLYGLKLTIRGEMNLAYTGERLTGSQCGRLDQCCAFGSRLVDVVFDGDRLVTQPVDLPPSSDLHLVIVDLHSSKDTKVILRDLNKAYPHATSQPQRDVQLMLGPINQSILQCAVDAISGKRDVTSELTEMESDLDHKRQIFADGPISPSKSQIGEVKDANNGSASASNKLSLPAIVGRLMLVAQGYFDLYCVPACPSQLTAPLLHRTLAYKPIQSLIYGGKWVGSGGDGSAQLVARSAQAAQQIKQILERELKVAVMLLTFSGAAEAEQTNS